jgi:hypothetical protein
MPNKTEQEKETLKLMIKLYCKHKLKTDTLPQAYQELTDYACLRLERCRWGDQKPNCHQCKVHCYSPDRREQVREVMKWAGPRMILYAPWKAVKYLINSIRSNPSAVRH